MAKGGVLSAGDSRSSSTGIVDTVVQGICGQVTGESDGVGDHLAYFCRLCKRDGSRGRRETPGAVVEAEGSNELAKGHGRIKFGSGKGAAAT